MARHDLSTRDISDHAASELEYVISKEKKQDAPKIPTLTVEEAMTQERIYRRHSDRDVTRVLFISSNTDLLNPTTQTLDGYINISELFDEVHILILRTGIAPKSPTIRVADNVWIYTAAAPYWWLLPWAGKRILEEQLVFASGFRPDLIVARDPFESALIAIDAGKKFNRPTQLHILEDHTTTLFIKKNKSNIWRRFIPWFTLGQFNSIRTNTDTITNKIKKQVHAPDIATLPRLQSYDALIDVPATIDLKDKYKPFIFIMLFVGPLGHDSTLFRVLDAARFALVNTRVGLIVLGDGPAKSEFQKRAKILGIENQVVFETKVRDPIPYLKSANLLIVSDTSTDSEEVVLKGAAAGIPMVMAKTERREDVFEHGTSAFLCDQTDTQALTDRINDLLNDVGLRKSFVQHAQAMVADKFHQDPELYREAYRTSVEEAFFVDESQKNP